MAETVTYRIQMNLTGRMTQMPDSQKIFGALTYLFREATTLERTNEFVKKIKESVTHCALSDMLPVGYLPIPQSYLLNQLAKQSESDENRKYLYKEVKKRQYIKIDQLEMLLETPTGIDKIDSYVKINSLQEIHAAIDSLTYHLPGLDPNLYSVPEVAVMEIEKMQNGEENQHPVKQYSFYLSMNQGEEERSLLQAIESALKNGRPFFLGPRASQGFNVFELQDIVLLEKSKQSEEKEDDTDHYLNTGMLLPDKIDFEQSSLQLFTSERRPYHRREGWETKPEKKFISFIQAGSLVSLKGDVNQAGKSIPSPFEAGAIVFGNAFLYPLKFNRRLTV